MNREGKVFVDANVIFHAADYEKSDVLDWITQLYEEVWIHMEVMREIMSEPILAKVRPLIESGQWLLFDQKDSDSLPNQQLDLYNLNISLVKSAFEQVKQNHILENRPVKNTKNIGELHSLAAAMLLNARYICSNDFEIEEAIQEGELSVALDTPSLSEDEEVTLIIHDTLLDFCCLVVDAEIAKRSEVRAFLKTKDKLRIDQFEKRYPKQ